MKKRHLFTLASIVVLSILLTNLISAADPMTDLNDQLSNAQTEFNKIPRTSEDIKAAYLKQEWNNIFSNIPFIGPVHSFFLAHQLPFKIIFNETYGISLTFILVFILWILTAKVIHKPAKEGLNNTIAWTMAIGIPIIFAHLSLYKLIVSKTLYLIFAQETFWFRTILWFLAFFAVVIILMLDEILSKKIRDAKELKEKGRIDEEIYTVRAFMKRLKEYLNVTKKAQP